MSTETRQLYASPNGDRWYLVSQPDSQQVLVKHVANTPSGGAVTLFEVGAFLMQGGHRPEQQALLRLIGTLAASYREEDGGLGQPLAASNTNRQEAPAEDRPD